MPLPFVAAAMAKKAAVMLAAKKAAAVKAATVKAAAAKAAAKAAAAKAAKAAATKVGTAVKAGTAAAVTKAVLPKVAAGGAGAGLMKALQMLPPGDSGEIPQEETPEFLNQQEDYSPQISENDPFVDMSDEELIQFLREREGFV